jgi:hypothetical protein
MHTYIYMLPCIHILSINDLHHFKFFHYNYRFQANRNYEHDDAQPKLCNLTKKSNNEVRKLYGKRWQEGGRSTAASATHTYRFCALSPPQAADCALFQLFAILFRAHVLYHQFCHFISMPLRRRTETVPCDDTRSDAPAASPSSERVRNRVHDDAVAAAASTPVDVIALQTNSSKVAAFGSGRKSSVCSMPQWMPKSVCSASSSVE